ncbi:hypothetical protein ARMGADRAFT_1086974 [Armillaria gallica]|uniref:Uncharacterized protein n=1 Tax=Armillaria gallica TaxID=47427 RepID=A0A2H3D3E7_ARMGA|nr:hypothetical protein ARMGADRAFT_1086974 [Armillaria gallica]
MPLLSLLPLTPKMTQDMFMHTAVTLLSILTIVNGPPHLIILLVLSYDHPPSGGHLSASPSSQHFAVSSL